MTYKPIEERVEDIINNSSLTDNEKFDLITLVANYEGSVTVSLEYRNRIKRARESLNYLVNKKQEIEKCDLWYIQDVLRGNV